MQVIPLSPHAARQWLVGMPQLWGSLEVPVVVLQWMYHAVTGQFALGFYTGFVSCLIIWIFCLAGRNNDEPEEHYTEED